MRPIFLQVTTALSLTWVHSNNNGKSFSFHYHPPANVREAWSQFCPLTFSGLVSSVLPGVDSLAGLPHVSLLYSQWCFHHCRHEGPGASMEPFGSARVSVVRTHYLSAGLQAEWNCRHLVKKTKLVRLSRWRQHSINQVPEGLLTHTALGARTWCRSACTSLSF